MSCPVLEIAAELRRVRPDVSFQLATAIGFCERDLLQSGLRSREQCLLEAVAQADLAGYVRSLEQNQLTRLRARLHGAGPIIAINHSWPAYRDHFDQIAEELRARGATVLILCHLSSETRYYGFEDDPDVYYAGLEPLRQFDFVDAFLTLARISSFAPPSIPRIFLEHSLIGHPLDEHNIDRLLTISSFSTHIFIQTDPRDANYNALPNIADCIPEPLIEHQAPVVEVAALGYPKLERLARYCAENQRAERRIVFASTAFRYSKSPLPKHGAAIVRSILENFPTHTLVFRPYPSTAQSEEVQAICREFASNERFEFDDNPSYLENYARSDILVSDYSQTALTYGLSTGNPVVWCVFEEPEKNRFPYDKDFGFLCFSLEELPLRIQNALDAKDAFRKDVCQRAGQFVANYGHANAAIADGILTVVRGQSEDDWIQLPLWTSVAGRSLEDSYLQSFEILFARRQTEAIRTLLTKSAEHQLDPFARDMLSFSLEMLERPIAEISNLEQRQNELTERMQQLPRSAQQRLLGFWNLYQHRLCHCVAAHHADVGEQLCRRQRFAEAEAEFLAALALDTEIIAALRGLVVTRLMQADPSQAIQYATKSLQIKTDDAQLWLVYFELFSQPQLVKGDNSFIHQLLRVLPNSVSALTTIAAWAGQIREFQLQALVQAKLHEVTALPESRSESSVACEAKHLPATAVASRASSTTQQFQPAPLAGPYPSPNRSTNE